MQDALGKADHIPSGREQSRMAAQVSVTSKKMCLGVMGRTGPDIIPQDIRSALHAMLPIVANAVLQAFFWCLGEGIFHAQRCKDLLSDAVHQWFLADALNDVPQHHGMHI